MADVKANMRHKIVMVDRNTLEVSGVLNVESFDSEEFLLETACGFLSIHGRNLHIKNLSLEQGLVAIEGSVHDMEYIDEGISSGDKAKGFFGKLFK